MTPYWLRWQIAFASGIVFERLWLTNNLLDTLGLAVCEIIVLSAFYGLWWLYKHYEVTKRDAAE